MSHALARPTSRLFLQQWDGVAAANRNQFAMHGGEFSRRLNRVYDRFDGITSKTLSFSLSIELPCSQPIVKNELRTADGPIDWLAAGLNYHQPQLLLPQQVRLDRVRKVSVDAGCTCPNVDGTIGHRRCIFCDPQLQPQPALGDGRLPNKSTRAFGRFDSDTAGTGSSPTSSPPPTPTRPVDQLRPLYEEALAHPRLSAWPSAPGPTASRTTCSTCWRNRRAGRGWRSSTGCKRCTTGRWTG